LDQGTPGRDTSCDGEDNLLPDEPERFMLDHIGRRGGGMSSPVRQTSAEIDRAILDAAARTFAVHGYAKTSVQQLADAVGYSKAGLLHRFASKQALYDAVVAGAGRAVEEILDDVADVPAGPARVGRTLELVTARALDRPGLVHLLVASIRPASDEPGRLVLHERLLRLAALLTDTDTDTDTERRLRVTLALRLVVDAVLAQDDPLLHVDRVRLQPLVVGLATAVLGTAAPSRVKEQP
jgi:AcrR family transcriptional regulator